MALVVAILMIAAMVPAMAAGEPTYSITVTNSKDSVSIGGQSYTAYKLFDLVYGWDTENNKADGYAYSMIEGNYFLTASAGSPAVTAKSILDQYFTITKASTKNADGKDYYTVVPKKDAAGESTFTAAKAYELADKLQPFLAGVPTTQKVTQAAEAEAETVTIDVSALGAGYYLVGGTGIAQDGNEDDAEKAVTVTAAIALTSTDPTPTIIAKLDAPSLDKRIDEHAKATGSDVYSDIANGTYELTDLTGDNHSIGDTVPYIIKTNVPNMTGYEKYFFVVSDEMSKGLTLIDDVEFNADHTVKTGKEGGFVVKIGNEVLTRTDLKTATKDAEGNITDTKSYYVNVNKDATTGVTSIEIVFKNFIQYKGTETTDANGNVTYSGSYTDQPITISYAAILNDDADLTVVGNENKAYLNYSRKPDERGEGKPDEDDNPKPGNVIGKTPEKKVKTYVTGIEFLKYANKDKTKVLKDVEFTVTGSNLNDIAVETVTRYVKMDATEKAAYTGTIYYLLKDGTFTDAAPVTAEEGKNVDKYEDTQGMYKLVNDKVFSKTAVETVTYHVKTDANGQIEMPGLGEGTYTITEVKTNDGFNLLTAPVEIKIIATVDGINGVTWTVTQDGETISANATEGTSVNLYDVQINNESGIELPSTGGIGTTIFYVAGSILVLAAAILLITKRRMGSED